MKGDSLVSPSKRYLIFTIATSVVNATVLVMSIFAMQYILMGDEAKIKLFMGLTLLFHSIAMVNLAIFDGYFEKNKFSMIKHIIFASVYLPFSIALFFAPYNNIVFGAFSGVFVLTVSANRLARIFEVKKLVPRILNGILAGLALFVAIIMFISLDDPDLFYADMTIMQIVLMFLSLINIMRYAFSKIQFMTLLKIMRKTYALEVLYGLVVLIISFSFIFMVFEESFQTYGDALWYSFALVTTIGFGDYAATGVLCRILSVILGIYGIIVVAIITSVIVNFYNEVKGQSDEEEKKQEIEENKEK